MSQRRIAARLVVVALLLVVATSAYHLLWRQHVKRFQAVRPGVLYRVAQPSEWGIRYLVRRHGVKTVLNLRLEDDHLRRGMLAVGAPTGQVESQFVSELGVHHLQWPMGREACWPWVSPWQFEEFYRLFDDPTKQPIAIHCVSGRHRTGTIAALFRLEYDHWPIERVLAEMYAFSFGDPIPLQEVNLRTYVPRPQPTPTEWESLSHHWATLVGKPVPADYAELVRRVRESSDTVAVQEELLTELAAREPFVLSLACRLIDSADNPAAHAAAEAADRCLADPYGTQAANKAGGTQEPSPLAGEGRMKGSTTTPPSTSEPSPADLQSAAALVADFGTPDQQQRLRALLESGASTEQLTPAYRALVAGIANRYTGNRVPFLTVLLDDQRAMPDTGTMTIRYCDMAVVRLSAILDERLINVGSRPTPTDWEQARLKAKAWLSEHPQVARLSQLTDAVGGRR